MDSAQEENSQLKKEIRELRKELEKRKEAERNLLYRFEHLLVIWKDEAKYCVKEVKRIRKRFNLKPYI